MWNFLDGVGGAFVGYLALYRASRIKEVATNPKKHWRTLVFDLVLFLFAGGLVAIYFGDNHKEAFMAGMGWQAIAGGYVAGNELKIAKAARQRRGR